MGFQSIMTDLKAPLRIARHGILSPVSRLTCSLAAALFLVCGTSMAGAVEVTLVLNRPDKSEVKGTLKEVGEDGTITIIGAYGEQTFKQGQYLSAVCPEPEEHVLARQSYLKGEYATALASYKEVYEKYGVLGWGAASLEGIANCHRFMGNMDAAIESYAKLLADYPSYAGSRRVKYALAQVRESKADLGAAVELYEQVVQEGDDDLSASSLRNIGNILYLDEKYEDALLQYLRVAILYQNLPQAPVAECMFKAGDCFEILADRRPPDRGAAELRERAKKYYRDVVTRFPQSEFAKPAQLRYQSLVARESPAASSATEQKPSAEAGT